MTFFLRKGDRIRVEEVCLERSSHRFIKLTKRILLWNDHFFYYLRESVDLKFESSATSLVSFSPASVIIDLLLCVQQLAVFNNGTGLSARQLFEKGEQTRYARLGYNFMTTKVLHKLKQKWGKCVWCLSL